MHLWMVTMFFCDVYRTHVAHLPLEHSGHQLKAHLPPKNETHQF